MTSTILHRSKITPKLTGWRGGVGPELVLIHGVGLTADTWYAMLPELSQHFTITAIDLPGHGASAPLNSRTETTLSDFSDSIVDAIANIADQAIIVGHSLGAFIALDIAAHHPGRVAVVAALNAIFRRSKLASAAVKNRARELSSVEKTDPAATLDRWFGNSPQGALIDARKNCERMLNEADPAGYAAAYQVFANCDGPSNSALRAIKAPMLCITGAEEPNSTPSMSTELATLATDGQAVIIEGARHMMPITHAANITRHLIQFAQSKGLLNA